MAPALLRDGHEVTGFARDPGRLRPIVPTIQGDAVTGAGLERALAGVEVAYYLIHSMEAGKAQPLPHSSNARRPSGLRSLRPLPA